MINKLIVKEVNSRINEMLYDESESYYVSISTDGERILIEGFFDVSDVIRVAKILEYAQKGEILRLMNKKQRGKECVVFNEVTEKYESRPVLDVGKIADNIERLEIDAEYGGMLTFYDGYERTDEQAVINMAMDYVDKGKKIMISIKRKQGVDAVEVVWRYPVRLDLVPKEFDTKVITL